MKDVIIFRVNDLNNKGGYAHRIDTVTYNLNKIRYNYLEDFKQELFISQRNQLVKFEVAGKYVVMIEMKKSLNILSMTFIDFNKDDHLAMVFSNMLQEKENDPNNMEKLSSQFNQAYSRCKKGYDSDSGLVELELDKSEFN